MRALRILAVFVTFFVTVGPAMPVLAEDCKMFESTATLEGKVAAVEDYYVLKVSPPICVELPPGDDLGSPAYNVQEVQIVGDTSGTGDAVKALIGKAVAATGHLSPPHEGANKRPVILEIETIGKK